MTVLVECTMLSIWAFTPGCCSPKPEGLATCEEAQPTGTSGGKERKRERDDQINGLATRPITSELIFGLVGVLIATWAEQAIVNSARYW